MGRVFDGLRNGVFRALYGVLYGLRMAAWFMLSILRRPIQIVLGLLTFAGWIGGVIAWPLLLYYGEQPGSGPYEWQQYAMFIGVGLAILFVALPISRDAVMPAAIGVRNIPYVIMVTVLALAMGDGFWTKVIIVTMAGFFPVLVNTYRGLKSIEPNILDRMRILDASLWDVFVRVRIPYSVPYIIAAQEITGSSSIVIAISVEWMISRSGLGYLINQSMMAYAGERVYAVALIAAAFSFCAYSFIHYLGGRLNWAERKDG